VTPQQLISVSVCLFPSLCHVHHSLRRHPLHPLHSLHSSPPANCHSHSIHHALSFNASHPPSSSCPCTCTSTNPTPHHEPFAIHRESANVVDHTSRVSILANIIPVAKPCRQSLPHTVFLPRDSQNPIWGSQPSNAGHVSHTATPRSIFNKSVAEQHYREYPDHGHLHLPTYAQWSQAPFSHSSSKQIYDTPSLDLG
jgi:hypothetical protein